MALLQWDERLCIGVPHIDAQHQQIFAMFNELHDAMTAGHADGQLGELLANLSAYTQSHFRDEETYMEQVRCPNLNDHRTEHERLTTRVQDFRAKFTRGEASLTQEVMDFLIDWLLDHIQGHDQRITVAANPGCATP